MPGTGPYKIARVSDTEIRFVRNPFFREWSHAAQPAGNPDAIVWRAVPTAQDAVDRGRARASRLDVGLIPQPSTASSGYTGPAQLHSSPEFTVDFAPLNTHLAPFNDVRVRQALNYAINRRTIVRLYGGPSFATPTCQLITPGLPGYRRYCPYTLHPRSDGAWTAPDLARARQLVASRARRGAGRRVGRQRRTHTSRPQCPRTSPESCAPSVTASTLHLVPFAAITEAMCERIQLSVDGDWLANYPDPSSYIPQFFGCGGGNSNGYYCNPRSTARCNKPSCSNSPIRPRQQPSGNRSTAN